jgi:hypothetical protein
MLRRLGTGFVGLICAAVGVAACSSSNATQSLSIGPTFPAGTLYAANATQNALGIYPPGLTSGSGPKYQLNSTLGSTAMTGPQSVAFDTSNDVFATAWNSSTSVGSIFEFKPYATGNVLYAGLVNLGSTRPRGIYGFQHTFAGATSPSNVFVVALVNPSQPASFSNQLGFYDTSSLSLYETVAGPLTGLNVPSGLAVDGSQHVFVANLQGRSVEEFSVPTPSPTPTATATPTSTPTPTPTPTGATATPAPTASPTATPVNIAPTATISGASSGIGVPTGVAVDSSGKIYVSDQASTVCSPACPAILIFPAGSNGPVTPTAIDGSNTGLIAPNDVKVDGSGKIYVSDTTSGGRGVIHVYAPGASGNVAPISSFTSPGSALGLGLLP